jgi:hypothetical protein
MTKALALTERGKMAGAQRPPFFPSLQQRIKLSFTYGFLWHDRKSRMCGIEVRNLKSYDITFCEKSGGLKLSKNISMTFNGGLFF